MDYCIVVYQKYLNIYTWTCSVVCRAAPPPACCCARPPAAWPSPPPPPPPASPPPPDSWTNQRRLLSHVTRCGAVIGGAHRGEVQVVPPLLPPLLGAPGELEPAGGVEHLLHPLHRVTQHRGQLAVSLQSLGAYDHKILSRYTFHFFWYFHCKICDYYILTECRVTLCQLKEKQSVSSLYVGKKKADILF